MNNFKATAAQCVVTKWESLKQLDSISLPTRILTQKLPNSCFLALLRGHKISQLPYGDTQINDNCLLDGDCYTIVQILSLNTAALELLFTSSSQCSILGLKLSFVDTSLNSGACNNIEFWDSWIEIKKNV